MNAMQVMMPTKPMAVMAGLTIYDEEGVCEYDYATPIEETEEEQDNDEPLVKKPKMDPSRDKTAKPATSARLLDKLKQKYGTKEGLRLEANIADVVTATLTQTLAGDALQAVADKYDTPNNCSILSQVKVNELIWSKLDAPAKSSHLRLQKIQDSASPW